MKHLLAEALADGALGFSTGLAYSHVKSATANEISSLISVLGPGKIYSTHLRNEEEKLYESVLETIDAAKKTKISIEISHLKSVGKENWGLFDKSLEVIEKAAEEGTNINFDIYPYTSTATVFYTMLPDWVAVGGRMKLVENLKNQELKRRIIEEMRDKEKDFSNVIIAGGDIDKTFIGKTIDVISQNQGSDILETVINLLAAAEGKLVVFRQALSEENFIKALKSPLSIIASDGVAYNLDDAREGYLAHPRSFGCFSRVLSRYVREKNIISLEESIKKMTALPALKIGLHSRGIIRQGFFSDITIFNPDTIKDLASFENPFQYAQGIHSVIINGQVALSGGKIISTQGLGQILK
jgi:N-acyl-D-aspartate/D-glutamate deacylase